MLPKEFSLLLLEISLILRLREKYQNQKQKIMLSNMEQLILQSRPKTDTISKKCLRIWQRGVMLNNLKQVKELVRSEEVLNWPFKDSHNQKSLQNQSVAEWLMLLHNHFFLKARDISILSVFLTVEDSGFWRISSSLGLSGLQ